MRIESIEDWNDLAKTLLEFDYRVWQIPYFDDDNVYHVLFQDCNDHIIEVSTKNQEVIATIQVYPYW